MTLEEAINHTDKLIDWFVEGMADENRVSLEKDIDALEVLIKTAKNAQRMYKMYFDAPPYADHSTKDVIHELMGGGEIDYIN